MSFVENFSALNDPRSEINQKHELLDVLFLAATAVFSMPTHYHLQRAAPCLNSTRYNSFPRFRI